MKLKSETTPQTLKSEKTVQSGFNQPLNGVKSGVQSAKVHFLNVQSGLNQGFNQAQKARIEAFKKQAKRDNSQAQQLELLRNIITSDNGLKLCAEQVDDAAMIDDLVQGLFLIIPHFVAGETVAIDATIKQASVGYPNDEYPNITQSYLLKKAKPVLQAFGILVKPTERTSQWIDTDGLAQLVQAYPATEKTRFNPIAWFNQKRSNIYNQRLAKQAATNPYIKQNADGTYQQLPKYGEAELSEKDKKLLRDLDKEKARAKLQAELELYRDKNIRKELTEKQAKHYRDMMQLEHESQTKALVMRVENSQTNQIMQQRLIDNASRALKMGFILLVGFITFKVVSTTHNAIQPMAQPDAYTESSYADSQSGLEWSDYHE